MPCLIGCLALGFPRIAILLIAIFSDVFHRAYQTAVWPVLGFFFMPLTTLAYAWAMTSHGSVSGVWVAIVVCAALIDLGMLGGGGWKGRRTVTVIRAGASPFGGRPGRKRVRNEAG